MRRKDKKLLVSLFVLLILSIGIVYAYLTSNLSITGSTEIASNTWDIHFANLVVSEGSVTATTPATIDVSDTTSITYTVLLSRPKQFYEFTVDMVNAGTLPGKINLVAVNGITAEAEDLVDYSVVYTANNNPVAVNDILNGGATKKIKVRVYYNDEIDAEDLPSSNIPLTITFEINYVQSKIDEVTTNTVIASLNAQSSTCMTKYNGEVTDQVGVTTTANNVYFNECENQRNVIFGGFCWQMIRTTETGGTKLLYNGEPVNGKCEDNRSNVKGIVETNWNELYLNANYLYGSSFTYDIDTSTYTLVDTFTETWSDLTYKNLLGKFTCKSNADTCSKLYLINYYMSNTNAEATVYQLNNSSFRNIGVSAFSDGDYTLAEVGYMYNEVYNSKPMSTDEYFLKSGGVYTVYWYADSYTYDSATNKYSLNNPHQLSSASEYPSVEGKYTFRNSSNVSSASYVYYIAKIAGSNMFYLEMKGGHDLSYYNHTYTYGDSYTNNGNGTFTINNSVTTDILGWYDHFEDAQNKYVCKDAVNDTCSSVWYTYCSNPLGFCHLSNSFNYKYSSGYTYDSSTNTYNLDNSSAITWGFTDLSNYQVLNTHHYTCLNDSGICSTLAYVYYVDGDGVPYYIKINNGKSVNDVLTEMLHADDVNKYNSTVKAIIDSWYAQNLSSYTDRLEDTVYCNDRSISDLGGWDPNGGNVENPLTLINGVEPVSNLTCSNITDQFAVGNNKAKLKYPVGLLQANERKNISSSSLFTSNVEWWTMTPVGFEGEAGAYAITVYNDGEFSFAASFYGGISIRPVITIEANTLISSGSGSKTDPWIIN